MIRSGILAIVLVSLICEVSEARGRNRGTVNRGMVWQQHYPAAHYYNTSRTQFSTQQGYTGGTQQVQYAVPIQQVQHTVPTQSVQTTQSVPTTQQIQPISYQSSSGIPYSQGNSMQAWAEEEARMMAMRGTCGHIRSAPAGCFVGVGCGTTCMGSGTLVGEAHYQGKTVRVWRR